MHRLVKERHGFTITILHEHRSAFLHLKAISILDENHLVIYSKVNGGINDIYMKGSIELEGDDSIAEVSLNITKMHYAYYRIRIYISD